MMPGRVMATDGARRPVPRRRGLQLQVLVTFLWLLATLSGILPASGTRIARPAQVVVQRTVQSQPATTVTLSQLGWQVQPDQTVDNGPIALDGEDDSDALVTSLPGAIAAALSPIQPRAPNATSLQLDGRSYAARAPPRS
ncbi:MAG: hypothetical protein H7338_16385 [Candidatus Sericytochromatia bacterium]|nr:hypothetical protein [Candidatus Sericytochromatia bacterium]